jgi:undecaprenyl-phosphate 4-deoxy-4-formamido-L-arabinose transferase
VLVSVVVPVYNSEGSLRLLADRLSQVLGPGNLGELILVNDASRDRSWQVVQELSADHQWIRGVNLMRNYGQHNALLCGIRLAEYPIIVTLDDDLQTPPEEIPRMLEKLAEGHDVVYGTPIEETHGLFRDLASLTTKLALQSTMGAATARHTSAFRAFRTHLREAFAEYSGPHVSIDVLLTWGTKKFDFIRVRNEPRTIGTSNYTVRKLIVHAINMMTGFSTLPLQLASIIGFVFTLFGMVLLAYVIGRYWIHGGSVPGFPFLASTIAIFSGAQLFALGIIGEYLARMHFRMMSRPTYTVLSTTEEPVKAAHAAHQGSPRHAVSNTLQ